MNKVINLISGPRNVSTALMYAFAQREDFHVLDEPFYGYYLKHARDIVDHPGTDEILRTMELNEHRIVSNINDLAGMRNLFVKGMAHHFLNATPGYLKDWTNVFLIRHPAKIIASFTKIADDPTLGDIGLKRASELFRYLKSNEQDPLVLDSDELLLDPEMYLKRVCSELSLPFTEAMLHWEKGGIPEDGSWASYWYQNVHNSEGFLQRHPSSAVVPEKYNSLLEEAMPYYNILKKHIIKIN